MQQTIKLEFELIQVALGHKDCLSHSPSVDEWFYLFEFAKKQALLGVCVNALNILVNQNQTKNLPFELKMQWLALLLKIQQRNKLINKRCIEIQQLFTEKGFNSCILKGQGIANIYGELSSYRQPGDIDLLVFGGQNKILNFLKTQEPDVEWDYVHANFHQFKDVEVEVHYRPCVLFNLWRNKIIQRWLADNLTIENVSLSEGEINVPSNKYNAIFLMAHAYHHLINGGIGLRQMMDYYMLLKKIGNDSEIKLSKYKSDITESFKAFGFYRFATAVMWVMQEVFALDEKYLLCKPNATEGSFLLNEIMEGGNFGQYDKRHKGCNMKKGRTFLLFNKLRNNMHLIKHYTGEVIWLPLYFTWHYLWKRLHKIFPSL